MSFKDAFEAEKPGEDPINWLAPTPGSPEAVAKGCLGAPCEMWWNLFQVTGLPMDPFVWPVPECPLHGSEAREGAPRPSGSLDEKKTGRTLPD